VAAVVYREHRARCSSTSGGGGKRSSSSRRSSRLLVARSSLASLGQVVQYPFCCGDPAALAAEAEASTATLGPQCRGEHALLRCYEAADGEWLLLHASLHSCQHPGDAAATAGAHAAVAAEVRSALSRMAAAHPALSKAVAPVIAAQHEVLSTANARVADDTFAAALATAFRTAGPSASEWVAALRSHAIAAVALCSLSQLRAGHATSKLDLRGPTFQFLTDSDHPAGSPLTYFAPLAVRPSHTPLAAPLPAAPRYGEHTVQVLEEVGIKPGPLLAAGVASVGWSSSYLPGCPRKPNLEATHIDPPPPMPLLPVAMLSSAPTADAPMLSKRLPPPPPPPSPALTAVAPLGFPRDMKEDAPMARAPMARAPTPLSPMEMAEAAEAEAKAAEAAAMEVAAAKSARAAEAAAAEAEAEAERCPVCLEVTVTRRVQLACSHSLCGGCATKCGESGHRRCPVCRVPHLLHPDRLKQRSTSWRLRYASWRVGGHAGAHGEVSSICLPSPKEEVMSSLQGGVAHSRGCGDIFLASSALATALTPLTQGSLKASSASSPPSPPSPPSPVGASKAAARRRVGALPSTLPKVMTAPTDLVLLAAKEARLEREAKKQLAV